MPVHKPCCFAVTGGPGAGKTALLEHLAGLGLAVAAESARAVIREAGGRPEPRRFCELMLERDVQAFHAAHGPTLFDRSLVDAWATARAYGLALPQAEAAVRELRLNPCAFLAPPWREIYRTDAERDQTWADAVAAHDACARAYQDAGYTLVELPRAGVAERAAFVLDRLRKAEATAS